MSVLDGIRDRLPRDRSTVDFDVRVEAAARSIKVVAEFDRGVGDDAPCRRFDRVRKVVLLELRHAHVPDGESRIVERRVGEVEDAVQRNRRLIRRRETVFRTACSCRVIPVKPCSSVSCSSRASRVRSASVTSNRDAHLVLARLARRCSTVYTPSGPIAANMRPIRSWNHIAWYQAGRTRIDMTASATDGTPSSLQARTRKR